METNVPEYKPEVKGNKKVNGRIAVFLAVIPGIFGIMGVGLMCLGEYVKGAVFFLLGLPMMIGMILLLSGAIALTIWSIIMVGLLILLGLAFIAVFAIQFILTYALSEMRQ